MTSFDAETEVRKALDLAEADLFGADPGSAHRHVSFVRQFLGENEDVLPEEVEAELRGRIASLLGQIRQMGPDEELGDSTA